MSLKAKALRGVVWNLVEILGTQGTAFGVFVLFARLLTPDAFGLVAVAAAIVSLLGIFVEAGFSMVIVRSPELTETKLNTAFWIGIGVAVALASVLSLAGPVPPCQEVGCGRPCMRFARSLHCQRRWSSRVDPG